MSFLKQHNQKIPDYLLNFFCIKYDLMWRFIHDNNDGKLNRSSMEMLSNQRSWKTELTLSVVITIKSKVRAWKNIDENTTLPRFYDKYIMYALMPWKLVELWFSNNWIHLCRYISSITLHNMYHHHLGPLS